MNNPLPLLGITGYSGSGKTTLLEKLLPQLIKKGLRVSVIKHSHHNAHVDKEGKDSWRMKEAGSAQVIMACDSRWALMTETPQPIPKILLHRQEMTKPLPELDENVLALATDYSLETDRTLLDINHIEQIAEFIYQWWKKTQ